MEPRTPCLLHDEDPDAIDLWFFGFPDPSPIPIDDEGKAVADASDFDGSEWVL